MSVVISALFIDFGADIAKQKNRSLCSDQQCTVYQFWADVAKQRNRSPCMSDQCSVHQFWADVAKQKSVYK